MPFIAPSRDSYTNVMNSLGCCIAPLQQMQPAQRMRQTTAHRYACYIKRERTLNENAPLLLSALLRDLANAKPHCFITFTRTLTVMERVPALTRSRPAVLLIAEQLGCNLLARFFRRLVFHMFQLLARRIPTLSLRHARNATRHKHRVKPLFLLRLVVV